MGSQKTLKAMADESPRSYVRRLGRPLGPVVNAAIAMIEKHIPHAVPVVKWGWFCYTGNGNIISIVVARKHVNLQFWRGAHLPGGEKILKGTGKDLRHIKLTRAADARRPDVVAMLKAAREADGT
ncbi:MAG: DUF1801 domain-containing protein [Planctomycetota bacterium]|nr:DUF1801 domain-containing protein [Planctomycetota bacterium]